MPGRSVFATPLGPRHALVTYDGPLSTDELLRKLVPTRLCDFSLGAAPNIRRVIWGPEWRQASLRDPDGTVARLTEMRKDLASSFDAVGAYAQIAGISKGQVG
jgi:hypothetical protein